MRRGRTLKGAVTSGAFVRLLRASVVVSCKCVRNSDRDGKKKMGVQSFFDVYVFSVC